jgi:TolA-binding protein
MKYTFHPMVFMVLALLSGCSKPSPEEYLGKANVAINEKNFNVAIEEYEKLIADHPRSPQAEEAMLAIARIQADELKDYRRAVNSYKRYLDTYPEGKQAPIALFLSAYLYHNELNDLGNAKLMYEQFLAKYPTHEMAVSAKFELENLGKKPEELIPVQQQEKTQVAAKSTQAMKKK